MQFLAQVNFSEVPKLPKIPQVGILQFYIAADDEAYGLNFENWSKSNNFRVLYFPEIETTEAQLQTDFSFFYKYEYGPLSGSAAFFFCYSLNQLRINRHFRKDSWNARIFNHGKR